MDLRPALALLMIAPAVASAQSVITLDDFDLTPAPEAASTEANQMEACLRASEGCKEGGIPFTIDDVVNLGIIDREEVAVAPAAIGDTAQAADPLPSIDLEVLFDYDSDEIRPDQMPQLFELSDLLRQDDFSGYQLVFLGHTDAKGSAAYNERLSAARAASVARFVSGAAGLRAGRTDVVGLGFQRLADPADPYSARNRRVQLVLVPKRN